MTTLTQDIDLQDALPDAVEQLKALRYNKPRHYMSRREHGLYSSDERAAEERVEQLVQLAKDTGVSVTDVTPTPYYNYVCYTPEGCGYHGRMELHRDLVANEQRQYCPECGKQYGDVQWIW